MSLLSSQSTAILALVNIAATQSLTYCVPGADETANAGDTIARLASHFIQRQDRRWEALALLSLQVLRSQPEFPNQLNAPLNIVETLVLSGQMETAFALIAEIQSDQNRSNAWLRVVYPLLKQGHVQRGIEIAQQIPNPRTRGVLLAEAARVLAQKGQWAESQHLVQQIDELAFKAEALLRLCEVSVEQKNNTWVSLLEATLALQSATEDHWNKGYITVHLTSFMTRIGQVEAALRLVRELRELGWYALACIHMAATSYQIASGLSKWEPYLQDGLDRVAHLDESWQSTTLASAGKLLIQSGQVEAGLQLINQIPIAWQRAFALDQLARTFAEQKHFEKAFERLPKLAPARFVNEMVTWHASFEAVELGLGDQVVAQVTDFFGGTELIWEKVHQHLLANS